MKLKLDENLGTRCAEALRSAGHDIATIAGQGMAGAADEQVIAACHDEQRVLVTLDQDFANTLRFDPSRYSGIAVLRLGPRPTHDDLIRCTMTFIEGLKHHELTGKLWMIERWRIREHQP